MVQWVVEQRQPLKGSSATNTEFMPTHLASVFSALLFITQQSQNWEEGCVLLDVLRFQQIKVFISKENHVPKKVSKRGGRVEEGLYNPSLQALCSGSLKQMMSLRPVYRNGRKKESVGYFKLGLGLVMNNKEFKLQSHIGTC
jgi:hypothetical protein